MTESQRIMCGDHDVTEGVQVLYDLVLGSMDWGSSLLSIEDVLPMLDLAEVCDFGEREKIEGYLVADAVEKRMGLWRGQNPGPPWQPGSNTEHMAWYRRSEAFREQVEAEERAALRKGRTREVGDGN